MEEQLLQIAETTKEIIKATDFNLEGVKILDEYIEQNRDMYLDLPADDRNGYLTSLGAFLAISILRTYGGKLNKHPEYGWGIQFSEDDMCFPFAKVQKQLENDSSDSVLSFFTTLPTVFKGIKKS
jgi:hypothetical protein